MTARHASPVWYELVAEDGPAAEAFYETVLGWRFSTPPGGEEYGYRIGEAAGKAVGGVMRRPPHSPLEPTWLIYFGVADVDRAAEAAAAAGAAIHVPPTDLPDGIGRFAFLTDPQGQPFYLMRGNSEQASEAFQCGQSVPQGHVVWNELSAPDPDAALTFYEGLLSIRAEGGMPMGALGMYRFLHAGPDCIGALMGVMPDGRPGWQIYFSVDDIDDAQGRVREAGGRIVQPPNEIPGGAFALIAQDGQGARFGLVGPRSGAGA